MESHDMHPGRQSNDGRLFVMGNYLRPSDYRPDYNVLEEWSSYNVIGYGETTFKGRSYICLLTDDDTRIRCSSRRLSSLVQDAISKGMVFTLYVESIVCRRGMKEVNAHIE